MKELYFHEDYYCQMQLLPASAVAEYTDEMRKIHGFSEAHWDGKAWTSIYLRDDHSAHLRHLGVPISEIAPRIDSILEPVEEVFTGYSTYRERCSNTKAWIFPCKCGLLAQYDDNGIVTELWLVHGPPDVEHFGKFKEVLAVLEAYSPFTIVDWFMDLLVACADEDRLRRYCVDPRDLEV